MVMKESIKGVPEKLREVIYKHYRLMVFLEG